MEPTMRRNSSNTTVQKLASVIKSARQIMRKDKGLSGELDRLPMLTWIMFLKFLDDAEKERESEYILRDELFTSTIEPPYRWRDWAADPSGVSGDDLMAFVNHEEAIRPDNSRGPGLFAYLRSLSGGGRRRVVSIVFGGVINRMINGYLLRDVINKVNEIDFTSSDDVHTLSVLYEIMLKEMRDTAGDSGEFYTPRPVVRLMTEMVNPQLGETVLDPAAGTGGFLAATYEHLYDQCKTAEDFRVLQTQSIYGADAKPLPFLLCQMNLLLHGLEDPQVSQDNSLAMKLGEIGDKDRVDVILTNPPFGGEEEKGILHGYPQDKRTSETALLFMQLIMRKLRRPGATTSGKGGRCGMIVPNGTLFGDGVCARIKEELLKKYNFHTIVRLPKGVFAPYTSIETNLLFFDRTGHTADIWYYEHPLPEGRKQYTKTMPLQFEEFEPLKAWWNKRGENEFAWKVSASDVLKYDNGELLSANLDMKNPNQADDIEHMEPEELIDDIIAKEAKIVELLTDIKQELM